MVVLNLLNYLVLSLAFFACSQNEALNNEQLNEPILSCAQSGDVVIVDDSKTPECVSINEENICLRNDFGFARALQHENPLVFQSCLKFGSERTMSSGLIVRKVKVELDIEDSEKVTFAQWADQNKTLLSEVEGYAGNSLFGEIIYVGENPNPFILQGVLNPEIMVAEFRGDRVFPHAPRIFPNVQSLFSYWEDGSRETSFESTVPEINSLISFVDHQVQTFTVEEKIGNNCQVSCIKESDRISTPFGSVYFREYLSHQNIYRQEWRLENQQSKVIALIYMSKQSPSLAVWIDRDDSGFANSVSIFNHKGRKLYSQEFRRPQLLDNLELENIVSSNEINRPTVGVCEAALVPSQLQQQSPNSQLILGPFEEQSFYGWVSSDQGFNLNGRLALNELELPIDQFPLSTHSHQVVGELSQGVPVGLIPLGMNACLKAEEANTWYSHFVENGHRVVNMSIRDESDRDNCSVEMESHPMVRDDKVLWVVAAGNQGQSNSTGCPQHLSGKSNLLIVGASDGVRVHPSSNFGENFVDIYADGMTHDRSAWGTSMAAPKVAKVAADIADQYPELSILSIKASIMLSAHIPLGRLPARSKGVLDYRQAMLLARIINQEGGDVQGALKERYCHFYCGPNYYLRNEIWENISKGQDNE